jgi:hypothetical protein
MKISRSYLINPVFEFELDTSNKRLLHFFDLKFGGLCTSADKFSNAKVIVHAKEVSHIDIAYPQVIPKAGKPDRCLFDAQRLVIVKDSKRLEIPFLEIGQTPEITINFEIGFPHNRLCQYLENIFAFHLLGADATLYHAASIVNRDYEIIITAWGGTGKTILALYMLEDPSASYKAEEQLVISESGESYVYTDACNITIQEMYLFPAIKHKFLSLDSALRAFVVKIALLLIPPKGDILDFFRRGLIYVLKPKITEKMGDFIPDFHISTDQPEQKILIQLISQRDLAEPVIEPIDIGKVIERTIGGIQYERTDFYAMYYAFVYANGKRNPVIEHAEKQEKKILNGAFANASCYEIRVGSNWAENIKHIRKYISEVKAKAVK